ncbi:MAG: glyoxylate/hydroxypyruvate reductase A [Pseudomonadota bacterium]|nr:glyoxylate/hydroxypyruvate reductase A [Pseudomonadota bacterium]
MKVIVHTDQADQWQRALCERLPGATIWKSQDTDRQQRAEADYLAAWKPDETLMRECSGLKGIINLGAGVDALLNNPALPRDVPIVKLRDAGMGELIADYTRYGLLHFQRDFDRYQRQQQQAQWREHAVIDKQEWTVGVLGLGAIGAKVAATIAADGYPVLGWSRSPKSLEDIECLHGDAGLEQALQRSRTLVLLLPDTPATHHIINQRSLALLPQGASLINPGRGTLIDEAALLQALGPADEHQEGRLRGALLDAFPVEPLPSSSPLWHHPRVLVTPHMAGPTPLNEALDQVAASIEALSQGKEIETVDPEAGY